MFICKARICLSKNYNKNFRLGTKNYNTNFRLGTKNYNKNLRVGTKNYNKILRVGTKNCNKNLRVELKDFATGGNHTLFYSRMLVETRVRFCLNLTNPGFINYTKNHSYFEILIIMSI
jgi:hypothetical protein